MLHRRRSSLGLEPMRENHRQTRAFARQLTMNERLIFTTTSLFANTRMAPPSCDSNSRGMRAARGSYHAAFSFQYHKRDSIIFSNGNSKTVSSAIPTNKAVAPIAKRDFEVCTDALIDLSSRGEMERVLAEGCRQGKRTRRSLGFMNREREQTRSGRLQM